MTMTAKPDIRHIVEGPFTDKTMIRMQIPVERGHPAELHPLNPDGTLGPGLGYRMETDDEFKQRVLTAMATNDR